MPGSFRPELTLENMLQNPNRVRKKWGQTFGICGEHAPSRKVSAARKPNGPDLEIDRRNRA